MESGTFAHTKQIALAIQPVGDKKRSKTIGGLLPSPPALHDVSPLVLRVDSRIGARLSAAASAFQRHFQCDADAQNGNNDCGESSQAEPWATPFEEPLNSGRSRGAQKNVAQ
ncbi:hypothetical protein HPB50_003564 [Hyalomma asiaticum]|uniref:Uncharacterized protein n=1 Tax=Hyalomma asiaticum TaxID=266040 RepID=A0ACB7SV60_HYAAI|nr:hypothetical protein HPB50_003564 [Hyalomma asiaticum]